MEVVYRMSKLIMTKKMYDEYLEVLKSMEDDIHREQFYIWLKEIYDVEVIE